MLGTTNGDVLGGFGTSSTYRKGSKKWQNASKLVSVVLVIAGAGLAFIALVGGNGGPRWSGLVLGGLLGLGGVSGFLGASNRSANLLNISVVVCIMGLLLSFQFIGEVGRETEVDCALAELYVRTMATDRLVKDTAQAEIFNSIFSRMNEMEDMMDIVQSGAVHAIDLRAKQEELRETDQSYIQAKLAQLHRHAEVMLESVLNNPNITEESIKTMAQHDREALQNRIAMADEALTKIKAKHEDANFTLTMPEYEEILEALMGSHFQNVPAHLSHSNHDELGHILLGAKNELPNMQGALERSHDNQYHLYNVDGFANHITEGAKLREEKQKEWEQRFAQALQRRESSHSDTSWLQSMPKHCVQENAAKGILIGSGLACAGVQMAAVYITLSLLLRIPIKGD
ncbi:hypothetical protein CVIRNUC_003138 [Coccomyxa viridis]|uniref:Uncharacterized protein n=1 Tax=Coccomyxa viridis TaxID=1274662 RepID=A0AAV1HYI7_9CHLO|nr:hypothetical protein CVIRNUC_003138 [Coccomyxa viridis]